MWNRLTTAWQHDDSRNVRAWNADRVPELRLVLLWMSMIAPLVVVAVRMVQLQIALRDEFVKGFEQTYEVREDIPARDGRILAADGSVLAGEAERYELQLHFRLIEDPADSRWLRSEALKRLTRNERRDKKLVEAEEERVLLRREDLWRKLAELTGRGEEELAVSRKSIQQRVAQIRQAVIRYREARAAESNDSVTISALASQDGWTSIWNRMRREFLEPSSRPAVQGPIAEEEGFHTIINDVDAEARAEIEAHPDRYPGVKIVVQRHRHYPQGDLAAHLIGSRSPLTAEETTARSGRYPEGDPLGYRVGDRIGRSGLELQYDSHLHGVRGVKVLIKNRRGEVVESQVIQEPRHGRDLVLTLDADIQKRAEQLLDHALETVTVAGTKDDESNQVAVTEATCPQGGCLIALDVHTGAILAAAAAPRFDLNLLVAPDASRWSDLLADRRKPLFPRATHMALAPGSVFKVITSVASVESATIHPDAPIYCRGYLDRPDQHRCLTYRHYKVGHGDIRLADALCRSCNVYFFTAARRMGPLTIVDWANRFGIGQPTGIDLPSEGQGRLPSPEELVDGVRRRWHPGDTLGLAIGQSELLVTPMQMARAMAAVANEGRLVTPHLAGETGPATLNDSQSFRPVFAHPEPEPITGLHPETLAHIREGLTMVVHDPHGTAYKTVRLKGVTIAGKTGTAETNGPDHAWFAGYVPAERPRIAFVVVLEHGGSGGKAAGPVAREFVSSLLELGLVTPPSNLARE